MNETLSLVTGLFQGTVRIGSYAICLYSILKSLNLDMNVV